MTAWQNDHLDGRDYLRTRTDGHTRDGDVFEVARVIARRFEVEEVIAFGESTALLRARDVRTSRPVAIKALRHPRYADNPEAKADVDGLVEFLRRSRHVLQTERRLLVRLRNAGCNAVPVPDDYVYDRNPALARLARESGGEMGSRLDPFLVETEPYLVLQHLHGVTLDAMLAHDFPEGMGEREALRLILPVVRVLGVLQSPWRHENGRTWHCVFQDLKPSNLMVDPLGRLTLFDFGGCQVVVDGVPVLEGASTRGYAPPECSARGPARVLLPCADVYTIGTTLLHMMTGEDPRDRRGRRTTGGASAPDLRSLSRLRSEGVRNLLTRCLAEKPSQRLADARQVEAAIVRLLGD